MRARQKPLFALTAVDLMTANVVCLPEDMPLRDAVRLLLQQQISGAPVVDRLGKCIGVFSAADFLRLGVRRDDITKPAAPALPYTCSFQTKHKTPDGQEVVLCALPPGVCPIQVRQKGADGAELFICSQPHCVLVDWQVVATEKLPTTEVRQFMTADPVTVTQQTPIRRLAQYIIDAHIHRIVVTDDAQKPIGIVSSTDLLAAVAHAPNEVERSYEPEA